MTSTAEGLRRRESRAGVAQAPVELYGECRDTTTTKVTKGDVDPLQVS
jgi:hypothetical protein